MTLLAPLALLVGLTALVPLILHLYQRRQRSVIEFSTNRFFTTAIIRSQRRLRLRRLLLLLLRVATCILLALALARPLTTLAGFGGRAGTRDVVILLDDSLSMQATQATPPGDWPPAGQGSHDTPFQRAQGVALAAISELAGGDRTAVITFTGRTIGNLTHSGLELSEDLLHVTNEIERLQPTYAAGDAHGALAQAARLFQEATPRNRLLLVLSDLQASDWRQTDWPQPMHPVSVALVRMAMRAEAHGSWKTGGGPEPSDVPVPALRWDNIVADQMVLSQPTAAVGQPNLLRVRLLNYRPETTPAELVLHVDGHERLRRPIELPGQSPHVEQIPLMFDRAGEHRLMLRIVGRDVLPADNTLYATVRVNPHVPVLLVDGHTVSKRGRSAATFLRAALHAVGDEGDAIQVDTIRPDVLTPAALTAYRVVILSEVGRLSVTQLEALEQFVQTGGGLAVFLGDQADRSFYNDIMGASTRPLGGLLPARVGPLVESPQAVEPLHILAADLDHPILQRFKGALRSALAGVAVYRAYEVQPRDAWVLASLDRGLPLLVERSYGDGRVLLCAAATDPRWTNLPLRRAFVPLCSRAVSHLAAGAASSGPRGYEVGNDLELLRGGWDVAQPVHVRGPGDVRMRAAVKVVGADPVAFIPAEVVERPGFYRVEQDLSESSANRRAVRRLAVNVPRCESSPNTLDVKSAEKLAGNWRLNVVQAEGSMEADTPTTLLAGGGLSRGIWDVLLWTAFVLVLAEPLIATGLFRFRRAAEDVRKRRTA